MLYSLTKEVLLLENPIIMALHSFHTTSMSLLLPSVWKNTFCLIASLHFYNFYRITGHGISSIQFSSVKSRTGHAIIAW